MIPLDTLLQWASGQVATPEQVLLAAALTFQLPAPAPDAGAPLDVWSTNYVLHLAHEVPAEDGHALLAPGGTPFPAEAPIHLTAWDWCQAALQGSARIERLDGTVLVVNYATSEHTALDCGPVLGHAKWRTQGRVRFGDAVGSWGDGTRGYHLVPYRTLATDPEVIPTGSLVYVPSARGVAIPHPDGELVHDGWFFAADVGGAIDGVHIDTFTAADVRTDLPQVTNTPKNTVPAVIVHDSPWVRHVLDGLHRDAP